MVDLKYLDKGSAGTDKAQPIQLHLTDPPNDCVATAQNSWGFFCDFLKNWWMHPDRVRREPGGAAGTAAPRRVPDRHLARPGPAGRRRKHILAKQPADSSYALGTVAVEPGTGRVRAMAVNRVYSLDQSHNGQQTDRLRRGSGVHGSYPNTVNPLLGGGDLPGFQAGSTFKMFTMLAALEQGRPLSTSFYAPQTYRSVYPSGPGEPASCGGRWCPQNASNADTGTQTMWSGFGKCVNTFFVQLEQKVGAQNAVHMAERLGLTWHTGVDATQASDAHANGWGAFTLGVADTTPLEMADAYASVAAEGSYCEPLPVISITGPDGRPATAKGPDGKQVQVAAPRCHQAVSPEVARGALDAARCTTGYGAADGGCGGWSTAPQVYQMVKRPVAGKTGTTDNNQSAWFIGMTPSLTVASFIADPDNPFHSVGAANHNKPIMAAAETLRDGVAGTPVRGFNAPTAITAYGPGGGKATGRSRKPSGHSRTRRR